MRRWKRLACLVGRHDAEQRMQFTPGAGVAFTVTSSRARCRRCGAMVELAREGLGRETE